MPVRYQLVIDCTDADRLARFWAAAVELDMPINVHTQFFFPYGDLGSKITADGVPESRARAKKLGVDVDAGSFPVILSMLFVAAVIVGGSGNRWGAIAGGVLVAYLPERFRSLNDWRFLVFGLVLMLLTTYRPEGLIPPRAKRRAKAAEAEIDALETGEDLETGQDLAVDHE